MNISDAARELLRYDPVEFYATGGSGLGQMEKCADGEWISYEDHTTATAALTLELEAVTRERDVLGVGVNQYGRHFRVCLAEAKCTCGLEAFITTPNYKEENDQLRQQLAEAREDSKILDILDDPNRTYFVEVQSEPNGDYIVQQHPPGIRKALKATLNPPADEK